MARDVMLLFDLDGTLWDSAVQVAESWNVVFSASDPPLAPITADDIHRIMGLTMTEIAKRLQPGLPEERRTAVFSACSSFEVSYLLTHPAPVYPELPAVLETLHGSGYPMAVVSNCQTGYAEAFLRTSGLAKYFMDYEEWERTGLSKGENIRLVMTRNHFSKGIYIGDTGRDQAAAKEAGVPFIHASYGFGTADHPEGMIRSLRELPALLPRLLTACFPPES